MHPQAHAQIRIPCSRATRQAMIFPSHPREPNPPGTRDAVDLLELRLRLLERRPSASTQRADAAAVVDARVLQGLVHGGRRRGA